MRACVAAEERLSYFVAGLTNVDPAVTTPVYEGYHHVQYNGVVPAGENASVSFLPSSEKYRYVIIQKQFDENDAICLAEVRVFLRGTVHRLLNADLLSYRQTELS